MNDPSCAKVTVPFFGVAVKVNASESPSATPRVPVTTPEPPGTFTVGDAFAVGTALIGDIDTVTVLVLTPHRGCR